MQEYLRSEMDFNLDYVRVNKFDEESAARFHQKVDKLSNIDPTHPIIVQIDSYGGNVDALASMIETLKEVKDKLEKDFASFGTAIGGGTTENPTIAPTPATSIKMSENSKEGDWFDKKEKVKFSENGQWNIENIDKCINKEV